MYKLFQFVIIFFLKKNEKNNVLQVDVSRSLSLLIIRCSLDT